MTFIGLLCLTGLVAFVVWGIVSDERRWRAEERDDAPPFNPGLDLKQCLLCGRTMPSTLRDPHRAAGPLCHTCQWRSRKDTP